MAGGTPLTDDDRWPWLDRIAAVMDEWRATGRSGIVTCSALKRAYGAPTVVVGPGELALAHQTDEYCVIERVEQAVDLYLEIARRWCGM